MRPGGSLYNSLMIFIQHNLCVLLVTTAHTCNNPDTGQLVSDWAGGQTCDPGALLPLRSVPDGGSRILTPGRAGHLTRPLRAIARSLVDTEPRARAIFTAPHSTGSQHRFGSLGNVCQQGFYWV